LDDSALSIFTAAKKALENINKNHFDVFFNENCPIF